MAKAPVKDYVLRIRAGADPTQQSLQYVNPNDETKPILIDGPHFTGYMVVRCTHYDGIVPAGATRIPEPASDYFKGRNRRYSIMIQGRFHEAWTGDDLVFGMETDGKVKAPTGVSLALKAARWLDPALEADIYSDTPWVNSPWVSAMNTLAPFTYSPTSTAAVPSRDIGEWSWHAAMPGERTNPLIATSGSPDAVAANAAGEQLLPTYEKRKKYFSDEQRRRAVRLDPDRVYVMDFYDAYYDPRTVSIKLPGVNLNGWKYWDGVQPMRYACRTRDRKIVLFCMQFDLVPRDEALAAGMLNAAPAPEDASGASADTRSQTVSFASGASDGDDGFEDAQEG
ncbi:hypothetical protein CXG81DRAFT_11497 [Caulochytrium protostelioides]|uniref:Domain of unknown function at the cortex 1 domain-containing protein n=1 Tax=Caulochytrium protostelioides TaxID=1555241 RepID=A0A4P9X9T0_9FUNG|nr:hypothetical protein CXG81DRAFT_11497 [Caulochytrium protostelioides]|eukprot:RKP01840.1 hypothetical protein CXG81DRAFT_11497 [Caulochytrium protostelioides]